MSWATEIEDLVGSTSDTGATTKWLQDGAWDVINRVKLVNPNMLHHFGKLKEDIGDSKAIGTNNVIAVYRTDSGSASEYREIPAILKYRAADSSSIYKASTSDPVYYRENGGINMLPDGGDNDLIIVGIDEDNLAHDKNSSDTLYFPAEMKHLLVIYVGMQELQRQMVDTSMPSDISLPVFLSSIALSSSTSSLPTFTAPSNVVLPSIPGDANVVFTNVPDFPVYQVPILTITSNPIINDLDITTISMPIVPLSDTVNINFTQNVPTFGKPIFSLNIFPSLSYLFPELPIMPITFTASNNTTTWDGSAQSRIIIDNTTLASAPKYEQPILESRTKFKDYISGIDHTSGDPSTISSSLIRPIAPTINLPTIDSSSWTVPVFTPPILQAIDWSNTEKWIEDEEDPEMLAARVQEIGAKIAEFGGLVQTSKMEFDKDNIIFQSQIQESIQNAQLEGTKEGLELKKFASEMQKYQLGVGTDVSIYQQNLSRYSSELQTAVATWTKEETDKIGRHQSEMQNNLNEFNEANVEYAAKLQIAIENAKLSSAGDGILMQRYASDLQTYQAKVNSIISENQSRMAEWQQENTLMLQKYSADIQNELQKFNEANVSYQAQLQISLAKSQLELGEDNRDLQKYASELSSYSAEVNSKIQEYTTNEIQKELAIWTKNIDSDLQLYSSDIQKESARMTPIIQEYQAEIQKSIQTYQAETGYDLAKYSAQVQAEISKFGQDLESASASFQEEVQQYTLDTQRVQGDNQVLIAKYQSEVQSYSAEATGLIQDYSAKIQKVGLEYQWLQEQYLRLNKQYEQGFIPFQMKEQQE